MPRMIRAGLALTATAFGCSAGTNLVVPAPEPPSVSASVAPSVTTVAEAVVPKLSVFGTPTAPSRAPASPTRCRPGLPSCSWCSRSGRPDAPTPMGTFYLNELVAPPDASGPYGPYAFGLSAHSDVSTEFGGGDGVIG